MFRDALFRTAFAISFSLHFLFITSSDFFYFSPIGKRDRLKEVEVTYIIRNISQEKTIRKLPDKYDIENKLLIEPKQVTKGEVSKTVTVKEEKTVKEHRAPPEEEKITSQKEYIQYYQLIRERIKNYVTSNYRNIPSEGSVNIIFTLSRDGSLKKLSIEEPTSAKNPRLRDIALESVRSASPYPSFPDALKKNDLIFSISIIFKNE